MKLEFLRELVEEMVKEGQAEWADGKTRVQALLYWLKPEEWANMISNWVFDGDHRGADCRLMRLDSGMRC